MSLLDNITSPISKIVISIKILRLSTTPIYSYSTILYQLITNKPLGFRSNTPISKGTTSKYSIIYYTKFLITNKLLNIPISIDNKDLLSYSYKQELTTIKLFIKY